MVDIDYTKAWIDRYLRNELTAEDETRFETALLESRELQDDLETSMAIRRLVQLDVEAQAPGSDSGQLPELHMPWMTIGITASLVLAVLSGVMYWNVSHEVATLRNGMQEFGKPHAHEIVVPLDIMRSASLDVPEAIIHKPGEDTYIVLDIELTQAALNAGAVRMALREPDGAELAAWYAGAVEDGRVKSYFDAEYLPDGRAWLEMTDETGRLLDRRVLEFR